MTPILRSYLRTLIPFGVVTSTMPGSGKTILTCGLGMLYGQRVLTWTHSDEELRKAITSVLADPVGTIIFDNLAEGTVIDSPVLARLITDRTWADRLLGRNKTAAFANDRVWTATGNNLRLGGDMRTRSVLVGLNPDMPRPEERTGFEIPNLDQWILVPANQRQVLWHLLVLVADWTRTGAPRRTGLTMRQFTPWAEAVGGFLAHHGIAGLPGQRRDRPGHRRGGVDLDGVLRPVAQDPRRQVADQQRVAPVRRRRRAQSAADRGKAVSSPTGAAGSRQHQVSRQAAHRADQPLPRPLRAAQRAGQAHARSAPGALRSGPGERACGVFRQHPRGRRGEISRARAETTPRKPCKPRKPRSETRKACGV